MIQLNLLSQQEKQALKYQQLFFIMRNVALYLGFSVLIFGLVLYFDSQVLQNNLERLNSEKAAQESVILSQRGTTLDKSTKELNSQLNTIQSIQSNYIIWTKFLDELNGIITSETQISNLSLDAKTKTFSLKGRAKSRTALLDLQKNLQSFSHLAELKSPVSNITERENIRFEFTAQLNIDSIRKL